MSEGMSPAEAGKKGAAIKNAKAKAAETGEPVHLPDYGVSVHPDGTIGEEGHVAPPAEPEPMPTPADIPIDPAPQTPAAVAPDLAGQLAALQAGGLSDAEALLILSKRLGIAGEPATPGSPPGQGTPGQGEELGPDPQMMAEYQERMKTYVPPVTEETLAPEGVVLPVRFADYVKRLAEFETLKRHRHNNPVTVPECIAIIVRAHWNMNTVERTLLMSPHTLGSSGPAAAFNPQAGDFSR